MKAGDLLVGWFAEYNATGQVQVSDNVNGAWTRAPSATAFQNDTGDIALYYLANSKAASTLQVTTSAPAPAYLQGAIGDYSGTAVAGPLDQIVSNRGVGTTVDAGTTTAVPSGELVFSALVTGGNPTSTTAGTGYTARAHTGSGSAFAEDILASTAAPQHGTATLATSTDWYAVTATFHATSTGDTQPPTTPTGLHTTSVAATSVSLAWNAATDNTAVTGYTVYRNGTPIGTTAPATLAFTDTTTTASTTYTYAVDAFDAAGNHSPRAPPSPSPPRRAPPRSSRVRRTPRARGRRPRRSPSRVPSGPGICSSAGSPSSTRPARSRSPTTSTAPGRAPPRRSTSPTAAATSPCSTSRARPRPRAASRSP